jgi:hypothetical protein
MPLKKKNRLRNRIIFWTIIVITLGLMIYVPKPSNIDSGRMVEYELH